ncbi:hypothetical protein [Paenibacillus oryzisoli]|uniref:hypothetical protein n=1 Tax=Paenibacillus oryzisoli TaxID=1850517 RepID=UPI000837F406|nr:hypothetical protein [Paenibacillus oryzisoli]
MQDNGPMYNSLQYRDGWIYFLHGRAGLVSDIYLKKVRIDGTGLTRIANASKGMKLYDADSLLYVWSNALNSTEMTIQPAIELLQ